MKKDFDYIPCDECFNCENYWMNCKKNILNGIKKNI